MAKRKGGSELPQPPWSYAPSEVAEWLASTAGKSKRVRRTRVALVSGFRGIRPLSQTEKVTRRLERLGFRRAEGVQDRFASLVLGSRVERFRGRLGGSSAAVSVRGAERASIRVDFKPPIALSQARKLLSSVGLEPREGDRVLAKPATPRRGRQR